MNIKPEPERPDFEALSESSREWIHNLGYGVDFILAFKERRNEAPEDVVAFAASFKRWRAEHHEWRKTLPVDYDPASNRWRMFGGPWVSRFGNVVVITDAEHKTMYLPSTLEHLVSSASEERLRELATHVYEYLSAVDRMAAELIADFAKEWNER
jgi:hypothetical protein